MAVGVEVHVVMGEGEGVRVAVGVTVAEAVGEGVADTVGVAEGTVVGVGDSGIGLGMAVRHAAASSAPARQQASAFVRR